MVTFAPPTISKACNGHSVALGGPPDASSPAGPAPHLGGSKLNSTLKKLWLRRPKFIAPSTTITPTVPSSPGLPNPLSPIFRSKKSSRRVTIGTENIGLPQDFIHSKHVGIHEVRQVAYQPRHSIGAGGLLESTGQGSSLYRLTDSEPELQSDEDQQPGGAKPGARRRSHDAAPLPRPPSSLPTPPRSSKVKRKSVPIHILQDLQELPGPRPPTARSFELDPSHLISPAESLQHPGPPPEFVSQTPTACWHAKLAYALDPRV